MSDRTDRILSRKPASNLGDQFAVVAIISIIIIISITGQIGSQAMKDKGKSEIENDSSAYLDAIAAHISEDMNHVDNAAKALGTSPDLSTALTNGNESDITRAHRLLDSYQDAFNFSVCYLIDHSGITIASSNRNSDASFLGGDFSVHPYFAEAIVGIRSRYFGLGITPGTRGYYASVPITLQNGSILGVAVILLELDLLENELRSEEFSFLVSPEDLIFLSGSPTLINRTLGPLDEDTRIWLESSEQFGKGPFDPFIDRHVNHGDEVTIDGRSYLVSRKQIHDDGWSVVVLQSLDEANYYFWLGVTISLLVLLLLVGFLVLFILLGKNSRGLREERDKAHQYLDIAGSIIIMIDNEGKAQLINRLGCETLGYTEEQILGRPWIDTFIPERHRTEMKTVLTSLMEEETDEFESNENPILLSDGSERIISWNNTRLRNENGLITGTLSSGVDITEQMKVQREREELLSRFEEKSEELQQVIYVTSHDLRSPMVNIQGFSGILGEGGKELVEMIEKSDLPDSIKQEARGIAREDIEESVDFIQSSIEKMDALIGSLLKISRLGTAALSLEELDMKTMLAAIERTVGFRLMDADMDLIIGELPECVGDEDQINQVFSNLIDNAIKYRDPLKKGRIEIYGEIREENVVYSVKDNGLGIPDDHIDKIFQLFHRIDRQTTMGEGLGLAAIRRILDRHNGKIWVESKAGEGSTFFVSLPGKKST